MTPSAFPQDPRPGDIVRCISSMATRTFECGLKKGHIYTVSAVERSGEETVVRLRGVVGSYFPWRFQKIASAVPADPVAARMAAVMRDREAQAGACDIHDLARAGFTAAQIIEYADDARAIAGPPSGLEAA